MKLYRYSIPSGVLTPIPEEKCNIRKRGGEAGLKLTDAPHIILSSSWMSFIIYSDRDFVIPPRQIGISVSENNNENSRCLKALPMYLNSSLVAYILFFHTPEWGIFRHARKVTINDVRELPVPEFTSEQVDKLARLQEEVVAIEKEEIIRLISTLQKNRLPAHLLSSNRDRDESGLPANLTPGEKEIIEREIIRLRKELQGKIDDNIYSLLGIPRHMRQIVDEFFQFRLPLDTPSQRDIPAKKPTVEQLEDYAHELKDDLEDFLSGQAFITVKVIHSDDLIECIVEVIEKGVSIPIAEPIVEKGNNTMAKLLAEVADNLRWQVSQWVYIRRGLRLFDGPRIHLYKPPRIIDWTRTQARMDGNDIIGALIPHHDDYLVANGDTEKNPAKEIRFKFNFSPGKTSKSPVPY